MNEQIETEEDRRFPDIDSLPALGPADVIPEGFETVRFLPGQVNPPPEIRWGSKFEEFDEEGNPNPEVMPIEWQLERTKKVAAAMNHAASHAQELLKQTIAIAEHQEELLRQWQAHDMEVQQVTQSMSDRMNEELQVQSQINAQLRAYIRASRKDAVHYAMIAARAGLVDVNETLSWGGDTLAERIAKESDE